MPTRVSSLALYAFLTLSRPVNVEATQQLGDWRFDGLWNIELATSDAVEPQALLEFYRQAVRTAVNKPTVVVVWGFRGVDDANQTIAGVGSTEKTYRDIVERIRAAKARGPLRMARLTVIGHDSVMQRVDGDTVSRNIPFGISAGRKIGQ